MVSIKFLIMQIENILFVVLSTLSLYVCVFVCVLCVRVLCICKYFVNVCAMYMCVLCACVFLSSQPWSYLITGISLSEVRKLLVWAPTLNFGAVMDNNSTWRMMNVACLMTSHLSGKVWRWQCKAYWLLSAAGGSPCHHCLDYIHHLS